LYFFFSFKGEDNSVIDDDNDLGGDDNVDDEEADDSDNDGDDEEANGDDSSEESSFNESITGKPNSSIKSKSAASSKQKHNNGSKLKQQGDSLLQIQTGMNGSSVNHIGSHGQQSHHNHHHHHHHHQHHMGGTGNSKPARIRTVLNEKQLQILRSCYASNSRPDALMKEQLVELTGLNPRVIRVWFQNKRCKDKKKNMLVRSEHPLQLQHQYPHIGGLNPSPHLMFEHCF
jgi:hypothetical protein